MNGDGFLDLYLTQYADWSFQNHPECQLTPGWPDVCSPHSFKGVRDLVFFSREMARFTTRLTKQDWFREEKVWA